MSLNEKFFNEPNNYNINAPVRKRSFPILRLFAIEFEFEKTRPV